MAGTALAWAQPASAANPDGSFSGNIAQHYTMR
jgi:hypothetical protein